MLSFFFFFLKEKGYGCWRIKSFLLSLSLSFFSLSVKIIMDGRGERDKRPREKKFASTFFIYGPTNMFFLVFAFLLQHHT